MSYARIDQQLPEHPKWAPLSDAAFRLAIRSICWARQPDRQRRHPGFIPKSMLIPLSGKRAPTVAGRLAEELVAAGKPLYDHGIWEPAEGGWQIHDFHKYGPVADDVSGAQSSNRMRSLRAKDRELSDAFSSPTELGDAVGDAKTELGDKLGDGEAAKGAMGVPDLEEAKKQGKDREIQRINLPGQDQGTANLALVGSLGDDLGDASPSGNSSRELSEKAAVRFVFEAWRHDTGHHRASLDGKRIRRIVARLREGKTKEELVLAITNRRNDPFLMGQNDTGRVFDGIETLLRDNAQVERLRDLSEPMRPRMSAAVRNSGTELLERVARMTSEAKALGNGGT
jgi:hypothetical protein